MSRSVFLACCALVLGTAVAQAASLYAVPAGAGRIAINLPALSAAKVFQVQYTGFWHREDYARFTSDQAQAEIVYAAADPYENAALEVPLSFARARDSFDINAQGALDLGAIGRLDQPERTVFFQPYALKDRGWTCVALKSEWDHVGRDPRNRAGRVMFGYICDKSGGAMTTARARDMAETVVTSGTEVDWQNNGTRLSGPIPVGNSSFPFDFGVHFNDNDSHDWTQ